MTELRLRPAQELIVRYRGGRMGILAVPGSGKTWTLSYLAAELLSQRLLQRGQEILIVTLVNSAVDVFSQRIRAFLEARGLLPLDYRVRTLHGLANDIVRERPELVGLDEKFQILDERESERILKSIADSWLHQHGSQLQDYLDETIYAESQYKIWHNDLPKLVQDMAFSFISLAKDRGLTPPNLRFQLDQLPMRFPLLEMGYTIYDDYERAIQYRGAVDFSDLIRKANEALTWDPPLLERLRYRWPYILEDEAQDSSQLQEQILRKLTGESGNWVRVGDPNQAIYETFTTANPKYLRQFVQEDGVLRRELPHSGRSTHSIIELANYLVRWTMDSHPWEAARDALQAPPFITPLPPQDPNPNPPDDPSKVILYTPKLTAEKEVQTVVRSLKSWLKDHPDWTVAVLAPRTDHAVAVVEALKRNGIPFEDSLLKTTSSTRQTAALLADILHFLAEPASSRKLAQAYRAWRQATLELPSANPPAEEEIQKQVDEDASLLTTCERVEDYLYPDTAADWLASVAVPSPPPFTDQPIHTLDVYQRLSAFRLIAQRWQAAVLLPIDQLILTLAQDLFRLPHDLALSHKLALVLRQIGDAHPGWHLQELSQELTDIARNERRFIGFSKNDSGFNPEDYRGVVVVSTMHKAKGLEWDRVYLLSVNNYDFPSGAPYDKYQPEKWFARNRLNLQAEMLAQLEWALHPSEETFPTEGLATQQARLDYVRERLRLLYVGITRAKRELVITWNNGRREDLQPAQALLALWDFWENHHAETAS